MEFITLNNGVRMPLLGFGVFQIEPKDTQRCVEEAISVGYRSIDTAQAYFNEKEVGLAINNAIKGGIGREELFITTKIWINNANGVKARKSIESSLQKLGLDFIDLLLIHQPFGDIYATWRVMSEMYKEGLIRAIGVSNFYLDRFIDFILHHEIKPAVNQIECHPFFQRQKESDIFFNECGTITQSWASFAEGKENMFNNETLSSIGKKYNKSVAQVILRWLIQRKIVVIPKTIKKERMIENFNIFDFALSESDMQTIAKMNKNKSLFLEHSDFQTAKWLIEVHKDKF